MPSSIQKVNFSILLNKIKKNKIYKIGDADMIRMLQGEKSIIVKKLPNNLTSDNLKSVRKWKCEITLSTLQQICFQFSISKFRVKEWNIKKSNNALVWFRINEVHLILHRRFSSRRIISLYGSCFLFYDIMATQRLQI